MTQIAAAFPVCVSYKHDIISRHHVALPVLLYYIKSQNVQNVKSQNVVKLVCVVLLPQLFEGIMFENESNIYIADRSIKFGRDVRFGILNKIKIGPT